MAYEIPQQLQYEEKIVFGLTFRQLAYALLFGLPALAIFFRTNWILPIRVTLSLVLFGTACMFMFLSLSSSIKNLASWFQFRDIKLMDDKMIQFIGIEKIEKGVAVVNSNKRIPQRKGK